MAVLYTSIARITNWHALRELHCAILCGEARQAGASLYRIYRNVHDASQALIVAELPNDDALCALQRVLDEELETALEGGCCGEHVWEATGWDQMW